MRRGPDVEGAVNMRIPLSLPWIEEEEAAAAADVVRSGWLVQGPRVAAFEEQFADTLGVRHAIAVNSGSSALLVALAALEVGPGDEVLCPDMSFVSTGSAALFLGARARFVDIELSWYGMDPGQVERHLSPRTKAIVPVHYAGHSAEMAGILAVAERHGIPVLEDAAESHLARYRGEAFTGTLGRMAIFSFTPTKPMTVGEGGMIVTDDGRLADRCRMFRNFGDHGKFAWHSLGFNFRMPEVQAAIGLVQLGRLSEAVRRRRAVAHRYSDALRSHPEVVLPVERTPEDANYQLYTIRLPQPGLRDWVRNALGRRAIATRLYYPALHTQGVFSGSGPFADADFPNALEYERTALSLPMYPGLSTQDQSEVITALRTAIEEAVQIS